MPASAQSGANLGGSLINFSVSPPIFEFTIGPQNKVNALRVENLGTEEISFRVAVYNWDLDEQNTLRLLPPTEQSLDQWLFVNPMEFTIAPGKFQSVRFSVRPKIQPDPGEHRAVMYITDVTQSEEKAKNVSGSLGVAIYGYAGAILRKGELHSVKIVHSSNPVMSYFDISNQGNVHVRMNGQYAIWTAVSYPGSQATKSFSRLNDPETTFPEGVLEVGMLSRVPILPETRRTIPLHTTTLLVPGSYVLDINGMLGEEPVDLGMPFEILPEETPQE